MTLFFMPRGIRNNNPGNIRLGKTRWQGQKPVQADTDFIEFETPLMGLRALMRLLLTYNARYGLDTVESIINRYAPPHENATDHYIHGVSRRLGVTRKQRLKLTDEKTLAHLAAAIVRHENGAAPKNRPDDWYAADEYARAAKLALS
jgi:hypothetical protein